MLSWAGPEKVLVLDNIAGMGDNDNGRSLLIDAGLCTTVEDMLFLELEIQERNDPEVDGNLLFAM